VARGTPQIAVNVVSPRISFLGAKVLAGAAGKEEAGSKRVANVAVVVGVGSGGGEGSLPPMHDDEDFAVDHVEVAGGRMGIG
jgi:hypothetical protein